MLRLFLWDDANVNKINRDFCSVGLNQQEWTMKKTTTFDAEDIPAAIDVLKQNKYISELFAEKVLQRHS